jgi:hypothetical protein
MSSENNNILERQKIRGAQWFLWTGIFVVMAAAWLVVFAGPAESGESAAGLKSWIAPDTRPKMNLCDLAIASPSYPGIINNSEVVMRGLHPRPSGPDDPHDTLEAIRRFHVTRLEWIYGLTPEFVRKVKNLGVSISGATSSLTGLLDTNSPNFAKQYGILDLNLNPITAPWMRKWDPPGLWLCVNNPVARESSLAQIEQQYDLGLRDMQRDDPKANEAAVDWGGCFCPYCMEGFRKYLKKNCSSAELRTLGVGNVDTFDYRQYLLAKNAPVGDAFRSYDGGRLKDLFRAFERDSTIEFHNWWREELNEHAGHHVPVSCNNGGTDFTGIVAHFDFWIGEMQVHNNNPGYYFELEQTMKKLGKGQTLTMPLAPDMTATPEWTRQIRTAIAAAYATGLHIEVPWDTYLPGPHATRFFGDPKDFSDLFAMVRACADILDGYEDVAAIGMNLQDSRWNVSNIPANISPSAAPVTAFVRAKPGCPNAPVVIHLINWSDAPQPFQLSLRPGIIFGGRQFRAVLITPAPYQQKAHDEAFDSKNYEKLVQRTVLAVGQDSSVDIPPLQPWGILVLEPLPLKTGSVPEKNKPIK